MQAAPLGSWRVLERSRSFNVIARPSAPAARRTSICWLVFSLVIAGLAAEPLEPERVTTVIEALTRLGPEKVEANPKLKEALGKVLEATKGTPRFVELVRDFHVQDQDPALLEIAIANPGNSTGVEAIRLILAGRNSKLLAGSLSGPNAVKVVEALGNTG